MKLDQFNYHLPPERIAQTPLEPRHTSRLMLLNRQMETITHHTFADIVDLLRPGDTIVLNNSRVIPARLFGRKQSGGKVEILLLKQLETRRWKVLVGGKRIRPGITITISQPECSESLEATIIEDLGGAIRLVEFDRPVTPFLASLGQIPLPPYIHTELEDYERYQTVFSRIDGSTAAPTAGLHFSPEILLALREKGIGIEYITLHIGLDTFQPVTTEQIETHPIHRERVQLTAESARRINQAKVAGGRIIAVGTTAVRTLETAALRSAGQTGSLRKASQIKTDLCPWRPVIAIEEETDLYIYPGYTFRAVDIMLTNFHLPKSTLLMLVSAFAGLAFTKKAYEIAIVEQYRFYSFGDAMLII